MLIQNEMVTRSVQGGGRDTPLSATNYSMKIRICIFFLLKMETIQLEGSEGPPLPGQIEAGVEEGPQGMTLGRGHPTDAVAQQDPPPPTSRGH